MKREGRRMRNLIWIALVLGASVVPASAAVPSSFSVQGVLRDGAGKLQTMSVSVQETLWDAQTAGTQLAGPYNQASVMATNGLFTVTISDPNIVSKLSGAAQVWIEITVGSDVFPRQLVTPGVFSLMSANADHATSADSATNATNATN